MKRFPASGTFTGRSTSAFRTLNTTALAPMPSARVTIAVRANPGDLASWRIAYRMSFHIMIVGTRMHPAEFPNNDCWPSTVIQLTGDLGYRSTPKNEGATWVPRLCLKLAGRRLSGQVHSGRQLSEPVRVGESLARGSIGGESATSKSFVKGHDFSRAA